MKVIVISAQDFEDAFKAFLHKMRIQSSGHENDDTKGLSFRTVNYYAHEFKSRLESAK